MTWGTVTRSTTLPKKADSCSALWTTAGPQYGLLRVEMPHKLFVRAKQHSSSSQRISEYSYITMPKSMELIAQVSSNLG